jgi:hypothetical protein
MSNHINIHIHIHIHIHIPLTLRTGKDHPPPSPRYLVDRTLVLAPLLVQDGLEDVLENFISVVYRGDDAALESPSHEGTVNSTVFNRVNTKDCCAYRHQFSV